MVHSDAIAVAVAAAAVAVAAAAAAVVAVAATAVVAVDDSASRIDHFDRIVASSGYPGAAPVRDHKC
jgi:hypothetical protein